MIAPLIRKLLFAIVLVLVWSDLVTAGETFRTGRLVIETSSGGKFPFAVELAETPRQMAQGLMYRQEMAPDAGMLFILPREQPMSMWMKNTFIPLDMVFIASNGRIVNIHERTVPQSLDTINSAGPVKGVLEINGGTAGRLGIRPGDRVIHEIFQ